MASSFTNVKDIEKPQEGDQQGVWGDTVNRNYDKIDANLGRVVSLAITANQTLATSQTAVANSDAAVINLTGNIGVTSVTRTLTFPSGRSGNFIVDTTDVNYGNSTIRIRGDITDGGVQLVSASDDVVHVYTNGTSVRRVDEKSAQSLPIVGEIRMYTPPTGTFVSAALPSGWHVANGNNGTANLTGRFIYATCVNSQVGGLGGTNTVNFSASFSGTTGSTALTTSQMPAHTHGLFANDASQDGGFVTSRTQTLESSGGNTGQTAQLYAMTRSTVPFTSSNFVGSSQQTGSGQGHSHSFSGTASQSGVENRPRFYRLIFIQYTGS